LWCALESEAVQFNVPVTRHIWDDSSGLSARARDLIAKHGKRVPTSTPQQQREHWMRVGVPAAFVDQVVQFQARWGGLKLPAAPEYDGGPSYFCADYVNDEHDLEICFEVGLQRSALPYSFCVDGRGRFGLMADRWVPLNRSMEGWVEAVALFHEAEGRASACTFDGDEVDGLLDRARAAFGPLAQVPEAEGLADTWWQGDGVLLAIYTGEAELFGMESFRKAYLYDFAPRKSRSVQLLL
jgi:hypothetical protein